MVRIFIFLLTEDIKFKTINVPMAIRYTSTILNTWKFDLFYNHQFSNYYKFCDRYYDEFCTGVKINFQRYANTEIKIKWERIMWISIIPLMSNYSSLENDLKRGMNHWEYIQGPVLITRAVYKHVNMRVIHVLLLWSLFFSYLVPRNHGMCSTFGLWPNIPYNSRSNCNRLN